LSPGCVCRKSPNTAAVFHTASSSFPSTTGGVSNRGIRAGEFFETYADTERVSVFDGASTVTGGGTVSLDDAGRWPIDIDTDTENNTNASEETFIVDRVEKNALRSDKHRPYGICDT